MTGASGAPARSTTTPPRGSGPGGAITRDDIAGRLRSIAGGAEQRAESARAAVTWGMIAACGAAVVAAYFIGRRRGGKRRAVIEIRRV